MTKKKSNSNNTKPYIICDPVHGMMYFTERQHKIISKIIDTSVFQRLRHIKQLSFAEFAFPGAVHTRFNHCIGAAYLSTKVSNVLDIEDNDLVMISSLLHDIGHGPLSHAFEHIYDDKPKVPHEKWNEKFIDEIIKEITDSDGLIEILNNAKKIINKKCNGCESYDDKCEECTKYKIEQKIVSSQMDVDRFDYLLRDSHFCGVSYGIFDVDWLIGCMEKYNNDIIISIKGVRCLEHYLMARKLMMQNICYHNRSSAATYLCESFFKLFQILLATWAEDKISDFFGNTPLISYLNIINKLEVDEDYVENVIKSGFEHYKKLTDHDFWSMLFYLSTKDSNQDILLKQLIVISNMFLSRNLPHAFQIHIEFLEEAKRIIKKFKKDEDIDDNENKERNVSKYLGWIINVAEPSVSFYDENTDEDIYISLPSQNDNNTLACDIMKHSEILPSLSNKKYKIAYLFIAKNIDDELNSKIKILVADLNDKHMLMPNKKLYEFIKTEN